MTDGSQQVLDDLRARLRAMVPEELVELCAQLLASYVVEGVLPLSRASESADLAGDAAGEESLAQLLKRLKAAKKDPVLERFFIDGENISVRIDGQGILPITEYRRPTAPPRAPGAPSQEASRRETSVYNRALYPPEPPRAAPAPPSPPQPRPAQAPASPAAPGAKKPEEPKSDRFSLIELE